MGSVLREPAPEESIRQAEERLGVRFPPSYRAFLQLSNGAYASGLGAELASDSWSRHGFLPVEEVALSSDADADHVALWTELDGLDDPESDAPATSSEPVDVAYYEPLKRGVLISQPMDTFREVLVPRDPDAEWELWSFGWEGAYAHRSFADFLLSRLTLPRLKPQRHELEALISLVRAGFLSRLDGVAELDPETAGPLAEEVLEDPSLFSLLVDQRTPGDSPRAYHNADRERVLRAAHVLGNLRRAEALPALQRAYERVEAGDARMNAISAMIACGHPAPTDLLLDATRDRDEEVRSWAERSLRNRGLSP